MMGNTRDALLRMYRTAKLAMRYEKAFDPYETPFTDIYGEVADGIYALIGEHTNTYPESVTYNVLHTVSLDEDRAVALLINEYEKNNLIIQPAPQFKDRDRMKEQAKAGNGYMYETPEGEWK